jgi:hypothetical protein
VLFAAAAVVVVFAEWGWRTWWTLGHGIHSVDSLWYHLPVAARWVQTGSITPLHHLENEPLTTFYPANGSLYHGLGMVFLGDDLLSYVINLAWLGLALLAAWCIGRPFGLDALTTGATAVMFVTPGLQATQPGGGYSDVTGLAFVLASLAILVTAWHGNRQATTAEIVLAAAIAGLAAGTKFQFLVPVAAVTAGAIVVMLVRRRPPQVLWWLGSLAAAGTFWYIRNLVAVGNPLPAMELELGPLRLHEAPTTSEFSTVLSWMSTDGVWSEIFLPGLDRGVGTLWWLLLAGLVVFIVLGFFKTQLTRFVSFVALVALLSFLVTPALLGVDSPIFFGVVLRYLAPGLVLGGAASAVAVAGSGRAWRGAVIAVFGAYLVALEVERSQWEEALEQQIDRVLWQPATLVALLVSSIALGGGLLLWRWLRDATPRARLASVAGAAAILVLASVPLRHLALERRYEDRFGALEVVDVTWALGLRDERIAISGAPMHYPLYGADQSNYVAFLGETTEHGGFEPLQTCEAWRRAINEGEFTYVEAAPTGILSPDPPPQVVWTMDDPAATEVHRAGLTRVFRLDGPLDVDGCPAGS